MQGVALCFDALGNIGHACQHIYGSGSQIRLRFLGNLAGLFHALLGLINNRCKLLCFSRQLMLHGTQIDGRLFNQGLQQFSRVTNALEERVGFIGNQGNPLGNYGLLDGPKLFDGGWIGE